jgi:hypothetical protein
VREIGLEANKSYVEQRPDILREQEEIQRRVEDYRLSEHRREEEFPVEISKSVQVKKSDDIERRIRGDVKRVNESVKVESSTRKKKKFRKLKIKKNKSKIRRNFLIIFL